MKLSILYRGPLASCNYACAYCPFAKRRDSREHLLRDRQALERFTAWVCENHWRRIGVLFTPWGEALIRPWYRQALARLTHAPHVWKAAIQTNLSARLDWVHRCRVDRLGMWTTFHPTETQLAPFVDKVRWLHDLGVRLSVGVVGVFERVDAISQLRREVPPGVYVWINALRGRGRSYTQRQIDVLAAIDPLFPNNLAVQPSRGRQCLAGETAFTVDGLGNMRRCHFVDEVIGNIYEPSWEAALQPRVCPRTACPCHIGRVNFVGGKLRGAFGDGILERSLALDDARPQADFAGAMAVPS